MTTIVGDWRQGIIVSDSQYSDDDSGLKYQAEKVYPIAGGFFGGAGHKSDIEKVLKWVKGEVKVKPKIKNQNSFIKMTFEGLYSCDNTLEWESVDDFIAIGTGAMAAEALLRSGFSAEEAVKVACSVDLYSCEPVKTYSIGVKN
jgi:20S proteasome alpha/beta subunit